MSKKLKACKEYVEKLYMTIHTDTTEVVYG